MIHGIQKRIIFLLLCLASGSLKASLPADSSVIGRSVAIQSDGSIVVSGFAFICGVQEAFLARYTTSGALDTTFNVNGYVTEIVGDSASLRDVVIQTADQKSVETGFSDMSILIERHNTDGTLDTSFNGTGRILVNPDQQAIGNAIRMQSTNIIVAGQATIGNLTQFFLTRYDTTGTLDTTFGTSGQTLTPIGQGATVNGLSFQSDGSIIAAGTAIIGGIPQIALARYTANGVLDTLFGNGSNGSTIDMIPGSDSTEITKVVVDASDNIIIVGRAHVGAVTEGIVARYTPSGVLDTTFGTNSGYTPITTINPLTLYNVRLQTDGKIVVVGSGNTPREILIARLNTDGTFDATFGTGGITITQAGSHFSAAYGLALQTNDQAVIAGNADSDTLVARYTTSGALDTSFNGTGIITQPAASPSIPCT